MLRPLLSRLVVAFALLVALGGCSKGKSGAPTAPPPPPPPPACALSTTLLEFGTVTVGDSLDKTFTLSNTGGGTLSGVLADTTHNFRLVGGGGYQLAAGQSKVFTVRFSPRGNGPCRAAFGLSSGGTCGPVVCTGNGQAAYPVCELSTGYIDFGTRAWGHDFTWPLQVRNAGGGLLWAVVRGARGGFSVDSTQANYVLDGGMEATVHVTYMPSFSGSERCTLTVGENAGCPPVILQGAGYLDTYGFCSVGRTTRDTVDFGVVAVGQSALRSYSITNFSTGYTADGVIYNHSSQFSLVGDFFFSMSRGSSQTGEISFAPTFPGVHIAAMQLSCELVGSGLTPGVQGYIICKGIGVPAGTARMGRMPESVRRLMRGIGGRVR